MSNWTIEKTLQASGYQSVYIKVDSEKNKRVYIESIVQSNKKDDEEFMDLLYDDIYRLTQIRHVNINEIILETDLDLQWDLNTPIVMYLDIDKGNIPLDSCVRTLDYSGLCMIFKCIVEVCSFLHEKDMIQFLSIPSLYRETMITELFQTKIYSFRLKTHSNVADAIPTGIIEASVDSSLSYTPPETLMGSTRTQNEPQLVWSLGVLMYCMLHKSNSPWQYPVSSNFMMLANRIATASYKLDTNIPKDIAEIIQCILVSDPAKRPTLKYILKQLKSTIPDNRKRYSSIHEIQQDTSNNADEKMSQRLYTFKELMESSVLPQGVDGKHKELYLLPTEFFSVFGMSLEEFQELKQWQKVHLKKKHKLF